MDKACSLPDCKSQVKTRRHYFYSVHQVVEPATRPQIVHECSRRRDGWWALHAERSKPVYDSRLHRMRHKGAYMQ